MPTSVDLSAIPNTNSFEDIEVPQILSPEGEPSPYSLLNEITPDIQREIDFIDAIQQGTNRKARREAIDRAMIGLQCCEKTINRTPARLLDGEQEAHLVGLACSPAPTGRTRWTLRLLRDQLVSLEIVESISHETVRQVLKKTS